MQQVTIWVYATVSYTKKICIWNSRTTKVVIVVAKLINYIRSKGMNHCQCKDFFRNMESEYRYVLYFSGWLNDGKMFKCVYDWNPKFFLDIKGMCFCLMIITKCLPMQSALISYNTSMNSTWTYKEQILSMKCFDKTKAFESNHR